MHRTTLAVLNYNGKSLLERFLPSVCKAALQSPGHDVAVIDNRSTDDSVDFVWARFPEVRIARMPENRFLHSYNGFVPACRTRTVFLLNNDVELLGEGFLEPLLRHFEDSRQFAVMPAVLSDSAVETYDRRCPGRYVWGLITTNRAAGDIRAGPTLFAHGGACLLDREKFSALGGFDELFYPCYFEEVDLCYRAWKRGWKIAFEPASRVYHAGGASMAKEDDFRLRVQREKARHLFTIKNVSSRAILAQYAAAIPGRLLRGMLRGDVARVRAYFELMKLLPKALEKRRHAAACQTHSDQEILKLLASPRGGGEAAAQ